MSDTNQPVAPVPGSDEHNAAMAAKFDSNVPTEPSAAPTADTNSNTEDRPEWLPEKFQSAEDFAKAYSELEKKLGSQTKADDVQDAPANDQAQQAVKDAGLDFNALSTEYAEQGGLSEATYESLEKAGIPKDVVDQFIAGQEAMVERLQLTAYSVVGGEESYQSMMGWAATNLDEAEIDAFNKAVNSSNPNVVKMAVMGLKGRYESSNGSEPDLAGGDTNDTVGPVYESWAQVREAMRDPKYAKDPAYRRNVEQKLARSNPI